MGVRKWVSESDESFVAGAGMWCKMPRNLEILWGDDCSEPPLEQKISL